MTYRCPGCGAGEGEYHVRCSLRPFAHRACCMTVAWLDAPSPHESWCPEWGAGPTRRDDPSRLPALADPWIGLW